MVYINEGKGSAYSLWIDEHHIIEQDQVGTSPQTITPEKKPISIFFEAGGETAVLVMQISNFHHRKGGFRNSLVLGIAETIHSYQL